MIYSENVFDGITYSPATSATTGDTINIAMVPTVYAVTPDRGRVVPCSNLASARAYAEGRAPSRNTDTNGSFTYKAEAFVSPTGQYYVEILAGSSRLRMDVANASTARHYVKNGVSTSTARDYILPQLLNQ